MTIRCHCCGRLITSQADAERHADEHGGAGRVEVRLDKAA